MKIMLFRDICIVFSEIEGKTGRIEITQGVKEGETIVVLERKPQ